MRRLRTNRKAALIMGALEVGLTLTTYTPGRITRYRFSHDIEADYFACKGIYTALGISDAESFLDGYREAVRFVKDGRIF